MFNKRTKGIKCDEFFGKGYNHIEFVISCFQSFDTSPSIVVIDMYVHKLDGSDRIFVDSIRHTMSNLGRIDAVAYKLYFTALMLQEYRVHSRFTKIYKLTYTFTDIGPFLYLSEQSDPHIEFQRFNKYYLKNKLTLVGVKKYSVRYRNPEYSTMLQRAIFKEMYKKNAIPTKESLEMLNKEYLSCTIQDRKRCLNGYRDKDSTRTEGTVTIKERDS